MKKFLSVFFVIFLMSALMVGGGFLLSGDNSSIDNAKSDVSQEKPEEDAPTQATSNVVHNIYFHTANTSGNFVDSGIGGTITIEFGDDNLNNSYGKYTLGGSSTSSYTGYEPSNADAWWKCRRTYFRGKSSNTGFTFSYLTYRVNDKENGSGEQLSSGTLYASDIPTYVDVTRGIGAGSCMTIHVYFTRNSYSHSFYAKTSTNGNYGLYTSKSGRYQESITLLSSAPAPSGFTLNGWRLRSSTGTLYSPGASYTTGSSAVSWYAEYKAVVPTRKIFQTDLNSNTGSMTLPRTQQIYSMSLSYNGYGFAANSRGWFESQNKGINNSYSWMRISFTANAGASFTIRYRSYGESGYDFGIFGKLDTPLNTTSNADTTYYKSAKGESSSADKSITYSNISSGKHYIDVKYRKDGSGSSNDDTLQVWFQSDGQYTNNYTSHWQYFGLMIGDLPTASRTGYTFDGWFTAKSGGTQVTSSTIYTGVSTAGYDCLILFAHWSIKSYSLSVVLGDGGFQDITNPATAWNIGGGVGVAGGGKRITLNYDTSQTISVTMKTGYSFARWSDGNTSSSRSIRMGASDTTYTAYSKGNTYTVSFDANGGSVSPSSKTVVFNSSYGDLPTPTRANYIFDGWYTAASGGTEKTSASTYTTVGNSTLYAQWTPVSVTHKVYLGLISKDDNTVSISNMGGSVTVTRNVISGATSSPSPVTQNAAEGTYASHQGQEVKLAASAKAGYVFAGFSTSSTPDGTIKQPASPPSTTLSLNPSSGVTYYVYFKQMSGNTLKYDETYKYFYFEDGYYPQSEVSAPSASANGEQFTYNDGTTNITIPVYASGSDRYVKITKGGSTKWFKFEPIRWRISDYGVEKTERNLERYTSLYNLRNYTSYSTNFTAVSDLILGVGAMHDSRQTSEGMSVTAMKGFQLVEEMSGNVALNTKYSKSGNAIKVDKFSDKTESNAVSTTSYAYSSAIRIASLQDISEVGLLNKQAKASDMVAFILGLDKDEVSYWTRDLSNLGSGIAITASGTQIRPWLDQMMGMRFAYTFSEGSNASFY